MPELILAIAVFIASHAIPAWRPVREALVNRLGEVTFVIAYTLLTLVLVGWLAHAYAGAPYIEVWSFAMGQRWVPLLVMPFACILLVAGFTSRNPFSLGAGAKGYDPDRPGIVAVTRHPVMWAFVLWAGAHLVPNGDAASLLLFGLLLILGLLGPLGLDAKRRAGMGEAEWRRLAAGTGNLPLAAVLRGRARLSPGDIGWLRIAGGLLLYAGLLHLHAPVIGVSPIPF